MNSVRIVPVTWALMKEALEHYWRSNALIKDNEEVKLKLPIAMRREYEVEITTTQKEVKVFRFDG